MATYPLPTLAAQITLQGITAPSFAEILASLQASFRLIYGADAYLEPDSQDGQLLAVFASAINDCNATAIAVYNSFSPATAKGAGLASVVKINGLRRKVATNSTVDVTVEGTAGTTILSGQVADTLGRKWNLPVSVVIPAAGSITVTATSAELGDIATGPGTITTIVTPTRGWQSVTNAASATPGAPVETDAALRRRQAVSTSLPAQSVLRSIVGTVSNLPGVTAVRPYENDGAVPDDDGIPPHSIALVVEGGDANEIAKAIADKKTPGTGTFGTTQAVVVDSKGVPNTIRFFRPTVVRLVVNVSITALAGYVSTTGEAIKQALIDYASNQPIGGEIYLSKLVAAASLHNGGLGETFNVTSVMVGRDSADPSADNVVISFNEVADLVAEDITLTVT